MYIGAFANIGVPVNVRYNRLKRTSLILSAKGFFMLPYGA
nr:hypothetical protein [Enterobacter hormaechei]